MSGDSARADLEAERVRKGEVRSVARLISGLENRDEGAVAVMRALKGGRRSRVLGITGPPGSGKSTLTDQLIRIFRKRGQRVGVLAVDPSSPFTGGAILGDRLRMQEHATDEGVFIRSLASRGHLGGLSRATSSAARVLEAAGYDLVLIETVGVGQSEIDVVRVADVIILVSMPGTGDDIQVIKAGIMEIGDIFVVNKADRDGADRLVREIRGMLETAATLAWGKGRSVAPEGHHGASSASSRDFDLDESGHPVIPPVLKTVAETGEGCDELVGEIIKHYDDMERGGRLSARRLDGARSEMRDLLGLRLLDKLDSGEFATLESSLAASVARRELDPWEAAEGLYDSIMKGVRK